ncbi:MAG: AAA family ATPase [Bacteroidetes bacterium]|nr:AAA family ATPase [Bacteroidota bacterium]
MPISRPDEIERIRAMAGSRPAFRPKKKRPLPPDPHLARYLFRAATGNRWMDLGEREPPKKMLFGEFWFRGELCILFADTNMGKSVLAVQIANSLSRRSAIGPFALDAGSMKVLYIDFELSTRQFADRYRDEKGPFRFSDNFVRADFDPGAEMPGSCSSWNEFVVAGIEYKIELIGPQVLIIDNISCLRGGTENTAGALELMKLLKLLKKQYGLSILVLAHTPKRRPFNPVTVNDLQGSKMLASFADSAFAIGRSTRQTGLCYLKQIKQRSVGQTYGADNVCLCRLHRSRGFLRFLFSGNARETDHIQPPARVEREKLADAVWKLSIAGLTQRQIAGKLEVSVGLVNKVVKGAES